MELVYQHRQSLGLVPLIHDKYLASIVQEHSESMASGQVPFGHLGSSVRCSDSKASLGGGNWCGENVAMGQRTVATFSAWMNSPGHRANIEKA